MSNIVSSPTTIPYLPTALGVSKTTLLLSNNITGGPYAWQLTNNCTITSNPYSQGGTTGNIGTYGLINCIAIQNGAISAAVWLYEPPGGWGVILGFINSDGTRFTPWVYIGVSNLLYVADCCNPSAVFTPITPGWHLVVAEEWANSYTGPYYLALYLDGQFIKQNQVAPYVPQMFGGATNYPITMIGAGNAVNYFPGLNAPGYATTYYFNGAIALVALYNRVLTTGDVLAIYQGNLVTSGLVAVWYGDDYNPSNGYWVSRIGSYTGVPVTSSYPPRGCIEWNSAQYSGPVGIWTNWQQC